ncbi:hypothetical protein [Pantanalinema sp. GBBB05]|uniref:hypothetical protein n=1 Tax=Pantanalinema sp. GBBB05 TaxID=2604139 RepID=UPI001DD6217D|nr:hypothetical protein [Pantanalinema sp. GBBB05]
MFTSTALSREARNVQKVSSFGSLSGHYINRGRDSLVAEPSVGAESSFPITELYWTNWKADQPWQPVRFTVPDKDTTISADGGELRQYDVHVAKMFEVTHYLCQNKHKPNLFNWLNEKYVSAITKLKRLEALLKGKRTDEGFVWSYEAANGNTLMGGFTISCDLAQTVASAYGLKKAELTHIRDTNQNWISDEFGTEKYVIPRLNLTGTKVQKWMNFVQKFQPYFSNYYHKAENKKQSIPFPVEQVLSKLYWKTEVPILLPSELPWMSRARLFQNTFEVRAYADANGYLVCIGVPRRGCDTQTFHPFNSISAMRDGELKRPSRIGLRDTFREIELARDIPGFFYEGCGAYCTSSVRWKYRGVVYSVKARSGKQPILVKIANSMIEAGER